MPPGSAGPWMCAAIWSVVRPAKLNVSSADLSSAARRSVAVPVAAVAAPPSGGERGHEQRGRRRGTGTGSPRPSSASLVCPSSVSRPTRLMPSMSQMRVSPLGGGARGCRPCRRRSCPRPWPRASPTSRMPRRDAARRTTRPFINQSRRVRRAARGARERPRGRRRRSRRRPPPPRRRRAARAMAPVLTTVAPFMSQTRLSPLVACRHNTSARPSRVEVAHARHAPGQVGERRDRERRARDAARRPATARFRRSPRSARRCRPGRRR